MRSHHLRRGAWSIAFVLTGAVAWAQQTNNHVLRAVPTPGHVTIDGTLDDWDTSAGILICYDLERLADTNSVRAYMMYDADYLYAAFRFKDPTPLINHVNPKHLPGSGWRSDSVQLRLWTDRILHVDCYHFTDEKRPSCHIAYHDMSKGKAGFEGKIIEAIGQGVDAGFKTDADGKGYVHEMRMAWRLLRRDRKPYCAGQSFRCGIEVFWGDPTGERWPQHRYADLVNKDRPQREFFWTAKHAWGEVTLLAKGHRPPAERSASLRLAETLATRRHGTIGPVALAYDLPADSHVTLVVEKPDGTRVRNLIADVPRRAGRRVDRWDGTDDTGRLVPPGTYRFRGLHHAPFDVRYQFAYGSPGNPPWETADGTGAWMADHSAPLDVVADDRRVYLSNYGAEGGSTLIAVDLDGRKRWGIGRIWGGVLARHGRYLYMLSGGRHPMHHRPGEVWLQRFDPNTGTFASFPDGKGEHRIARYDPSRPIAARRHEGALVAARGYTAGWLHNEVPGMAAAGDRLYVSMFYENKVLAIDPTQGKTVGEIALKRPVGLAGDAAGRLYAVSGTQVVRVDAQGKATPVVTTGLEAPVGLAVDRAGRLYVSDWRGAMCVKVFSPQGKLVRTIGRRGGRPLAGAHDPSGMFRPWGVTVDARSRVWVAEHDFHPKRISVWNPDGTLAREFCGPTYYAATECNVNPHHPTQAFMMGNVLELDWQRGDWRVTGTLWRPTHPQALVGPCGEGMVYEVVKHRGRDLLVASRHAGFVCIADLAPGDSPGAKWRGSPGDSPGAKPLAALGHIRWLLGDGAMPELVEKHLWDDPKRLAWAKEKFPGAFSGIAVHRARDVHRMIQASRAHPPRTQFIWTDANGDALVQDSEIRFYTEQEAGGVVLGTHWRAAYGPDLTLYPAAAHKQRKTWVWRLPVKAWNSCGAPVYDIKQAKLIVCVEPQHFLNSIWADAKGNVLLNHRPMQMFSPAGKLLWRYPNNWPGVHGSHKAPQDRRGQLIGPLKVIGSAELAHGVGEVFCMNGNMGKAFLMTTDGLLVGSLFRDCRSAPASFPPKAVRGHSIIETSPGGEWFGGEFFRNRADGKLYIGSAAREVQLLSEVVGLDTTRRIPPKPIRLTPADYTAAEKLLAQRAAKKQADQAKTAIVPLAKRISGKRAPTIDGDLREWARRREWMADCRFDTTHSASAMFAYDKEHLYAAFDVADATPMINAGKDWKLLFKSGDALVIELGAGKRGTSTASRPIDGDVRLLVSVMAGKPVAVLYRYVVPGTPKPEEFSSPVGTTKIDRVAVIRTARIGLKRQADRYSLEIAAPLTALGLRLRKGLVLRGDFGVIYSDRLGLKNELRMYWSNKATGIVTDIFSEAAIQPHLWGALVVE